MTQEIKIDHDENEALLGMTTQVVSAYLGNNSVPSAQISEVITTIYESLAKLSSPEPEAEPEPMKPAVSIKKSITPEHIICLEDGKHLKMLKRHLRTTYNLSPEEYRAKWGLPADYPMVAPNYAQQRSEFAKKIGLGRQSTGRKRRKKV
jgi:predicted transcriptional regulator